MTARRYRQERVALDGGGAYIRLIPEPAPETPEEMQEVLLESQRLTRETGMMVVADLRGPEAPDA